MLFDDAFANRQAQTSAFAFVFRRKERLGDLGQHGRIDAEPVSLTSIATARTSPSRRAGATDTPKHRHSHRIGSVRKKIQQHLAKLLSVGRQDGRRRVMRPFNANRPLVEHVLNQLHCSRQLIGKIEGASDNLGCGAKLEQIRTRRLIRFNSCSTISATFVEDRSSASCSEPIRSAIRP